MATDNKKEFEAWSYEIATACDTSGNYYGWSKRLDFVRPHVPSASIRNLQHLTLKKPNTALTDYKRFMGYEEEVDPVERLRFFCSLAMEGQDWIDVEPFFDDVVKQIKSLQAENEKLKQSLEQTEDINDAIEPACEKLPDNWTISINLEKGAGHAALFNEKFDQIEYSSVDNSITTDIRMLIKIAQNLTQ